LVKGFRNPGISQIVGLTLVGHWVLGLRETGRGKRKREEGKE